MAGKDLTAAEKAFLILLMAENREVSNAELTQRYGISLTGGERKTLNDEKLVTSRKAGRGLAHELTDQGWARCKEELVAPYVKGTGPAYPALHALLGALHRYLGGHDQSLADLFIPSEKPIEKATPAPTKEPPARPKAKPDLDTRLLAAYREKASAPGAWVKLVDLRPAIKGRPKKDEVNEALKRLALARQVILLPEENQKTLTRQDRNAAVRFGGEDNHLIRIETA